MANEIQVRTQLTVKKDNLDYKSSPVAFNADLDGEAKGQTPGGLTISIYGTDIDLSELTTPGWAHIRNLDSTNYVEYGIFDVETDKFYPLGELLPGESTVLRLSRNLGEEYEGTGTGTTAPTNTLHFKANTAACKVLVEAFEK